MAKKDLELNITANTEKAIQQMAKVIDKQEVMIQKLRKTTREGRSTSKSMSGVGGAIAGWAAGVVTIGTVIRGITGIATELEKVKGLQKAFYDMALTNEDRLLKLARLRGDVSIEMIEKMRKKVTDLALETSVSYDVANKLLFYMESAMGIGPAATSAAKKAAEFAGPARIAPEEVSILPAVFLKWGGVTPERQAQLLNQLYFGAKASLAEEKEYLPQLLKVQAVAKELGFSYAETIALMTTAIEAAGVGEAGQVMKATMLYGTGKTKKAREYLTKEARKKGLDFGEMGAVERYWFTADLYKEVREKGPRAEDVFKSAIAGKGAQYFMQMFSESARLRYEEVLPVIVEGLTSTILDEMAKQFQKIPLAVSARHAARTETGGARIGEEYQPGVELRKTATAALEATESTLRGWGEYIGFTITPEAGPLKLKTRRMQAAILRENLLLALEATEKGTPERAALLQLYGQTWEAQPFVTRPDYLEKVYKATKGYELIEERGRLAPEAFRQEMFEEMGMPEYGEMYRKRRPSYIRGLRYQYGLQEEGWPEQAEDTAKKLNNAAAKLDSSATKLDSTANMLEQISNLGIPNQGALD